MKLLAPFLAFAALGFAIPAEATPRQFYCSYSVSASGARILDQSLTEIHDGDNAFTVAVPGIPGARFLLSASGPDVSIRLEFDKDRWVDIEGVGTAQGRFRQGSLELYASCLVIDRR